MSGAHQHYTPHEGKHDTICFIRLYIKLRHLILFLVQMKKKEIWEGIALQMPIKQFFFICLLLGGQSMPNSQAAGRRQSLFAGGCRLWTEASALAPGRPRSFATPPSLTSASRQRAPSRRVRAGASGLRARTSLQASWEFSTGRQTNPRHLSRRLRQTSVSLVRLFSSHPSPKDVNVLSLWFSVCFAYKAYSDLQLLTPSTVWMDCTI